MAEQGEERLRELESRLAHFERLADDLSSMVVAQGRELDRLSLQVRQLTESLRGLHSVLEHSPQDDKPPPHY